MIPLLASCASKIRTLAGLFARLLLAMGFVLTGCDRWFGAERTKEVLAPIHAQIKALNRRDATAAIASMHPNAPGLDQARQLTEQLTAAYDLVYMIQSLTVISEDQTEARVRFVQMTEKVSGPEFRRNRVVGVHTLRKFQGSWKIFSTQMESIDYLDK